MVGSGVDGATGDADDAVGGAIEEMVVAVDRADGEPVRVAGTPPPRQATSTNPPNRAITASHTFLRHLTQMPIGSLSLFPYKRHSYCARVLNGCQVAVDLLDNLYPFRAGDAPDA